MLLTEVTYMYKSFQMYDSFSFDLTNQAALSIDNSLSLKKPETFETSNNNANNYLSVVVSEDTKETFGDYFDEKYPRWTYFVLLLIGLFGNVLCLVIFSQKSMRKNSTFIYLAFLSMVDLSVLTLGLGDIILISYFKFEIRNRSLFLCRFVSFLIYSSTHLSSFILASVSIDRAIATNFITFSKIYCKPNIAYKIILVNILIAAFINFHNLIFLGYETKTNLKSAKTDLYNNTQLASLSSIDYINLNSYNNLTVSTCQCAALKDSNYDKFLPYFQWIDLLFYAIIPFFTMAICTFLIVRVLFLSNKRLNKNKKHANVAGSATATSVRKSSDQLSVNLLNKKPNNARSNKAKHLTYTLITLNCLFFCLVSPLVIALIALNGKETTNKMFINIVYLLAYSNHSFNFILYGFSSPPFRESIFKLLRIKQAKK